MHGNDLKYRPSLRWPPPPPPHPVSIMKVLNKCILILTTIHNFKNFKTYLTDISDKAKTLDFFCRKIAILAGMANKERLVCDLCRFSLSISAVFSVCLFCFVLAVFFLELSIVLFAISTKSGKSRLIDKPDFDHIAKTNWCENHTLLIEDYYILLILGFGFITRKNRLYCCTYGPGIIHTDRLPDG